MPTSVGTLIVGGGPAGAAAALTLARAGHPVTLVERDHGPKHRVCGEFLSTEALQLLGNLGIRPETYGAHAIYTVRVASTSHCAESTLPFPALSLTRCCLDARLLEEAARSGVSVLRGQTVEQLAVQGEEFRAHLGGGESVTAREVILATGKYDLRGFPRPAGQQGDLVALKMYLRLRPGQASALRHSVELLLHPHGYTGLQLAEDGSANLCSLVRRGHLAQLRGWPGLIEELTQNNSHAAQRLEGAEPLLDKPLAVSGIPYGFVRRRALAPMLYAVGDQAAVIPSFTGDGMSIAIYSGIRAAQAVLADQPATIFQPALHRELSRQVSGATALSRALVHPLLGSVVMRGALLWPGLLRSVATLTRLSQPVRSPAAPITAQGNVRAQRGVFREQLR